MNTTVKDTVKCPLCDRDAPFGCTEKHHLVPKCKKGKMTIRLCIDCARMIHQVFSPKELEKKYHTIELIREYPEIRKWRTWLRNRPTKFGVAMARKKRKRR